VVPRTIIIPLDGSEFAARALPVARAVAQRVGARLIVMSTHWESDVDEAAAYLRLVAKESADIETEVLLVDEHPAGRAIASVSRAHPDSIVCMTSHGRGAVRWAILGSVAEDVVREARESVLLVGRHCATDWPSHLEQLLVCVDGFSAAEPIVPVASEWAKALGLDVRVVMVAHPLDVQGATHPNKAVDWITEQFVSDGVAAKAVIVRGSHVAGTIANFARELPAALIATNMSSRHGMARVAMGSVATGVLGVAPCPVLVTFSP
jgi:nucleotide-binding universal stress UspA family protein